MINFQIPTLARTEMKTVYVNMTALSFYYFSSYNRVFHNKHEVTIHGNVGDKGFYSSKESYLQQRWIKSLMLILLSLPGMRLEV